MQVNMLEARNQLSKLVKAASAGEEVVIANDGKPVARIVAIQHGHKTTGFGSLRGKIVFGEDWDSPETNAGIAATLRASALFPATKSKPAPGRTASAAKRKA